jgi:hypothetical protein
LVDTGKVLWAEIAISKYKIGQTIPKIYPGGFREDLFNSMYHISFAESEEDSPPKISAATTKGKIRYLLDNNNAIFV